MATHNPPPPPRWQIISGIAVLAVGVLALSAVVFSGRKQPPVPVKTTPPGPISPVEQTPISGSARIFQIRLSLPHGEETSRDSHKQYGFWTPSKETQLNFKNDRAAPGQKAQWQAGPDINDTAIYFGEILAGRKIYEGVNWKKDRGVLGWRRTLAYGSGSSVRKDGWWWTMTVKDKFDIVKFAQLYAKIWYADAVPNKFTHDKYVYPDRDDPTNKEKWEREDIFVEETLP